MEIDEVMALYGKSSATYDELVMQTAYKHQIDLAHWLVDEVGDSSVRVLDLGCGTGLSGTALHEKGYELIGIDATQSMLDLAKEKQIYKELICQDINDELQVATDSVDAVIMIGAMEFVKDPQKLFEEINRVTKQNELFLCSVAQLVGGRSSITQFSKDKFERLARSNGFHTIRHEKLPGYKTHKESVVYHGFLLGKE